MKREKKGYPDKYGFTKIEVGKVKSYSLTDLADRQGSKRAVEIAYNRLRCAAALDKMRGKAVLRTRRDGDIVNVERLK